MDQGKRTKEAQGDTIKESSKIGGPFKVGPPVFQERRVEIFDQIFQQQQKIIESAEHKPIVITLKDGKQIPGVSFETTPLKIALGISKNLAARTIVAKVKYTNRIQLEFAKGEIVDTDKEDQPKDVVKEASPQKPELWDLNRPLEGDCTMELLPFEDAQGKETFWHSSAHLLGATLESLYGCNLCIGPPLENGFFYDSYMGDAKVTTGDYEKIEKAYQKIASEKAPFQRIVLTKQQALELFQTNPFKVQLITNKIPDNGITTAYKCGKLIDLCTGPHVPTTDRIKAFAVTKNSSAYWLGKKTNDDLQRVYGIAFPDKDQLKEYIQIQEDLAKRDHRNVGKQNQLFLFNPLSPGSAFFYPDGTHIYNRMMNFIRGQYNLRGFQEVISPNFYNVHLWKVSGHYDKYKENMFLIQMEEGEYGVKPMNCPGHCLMFDMIQHSYRDLPIRFADFGVLHRNEVHGALSGLTRVRRFQQDDAHIFCRHDQLQQEIFSALDFLAYVYKLFGFDYKLYLSTRPEKFLGTIDIWDNAEKSLKESLDLFGRPYEINEGDGAFYGPKIDVKLFDAYKREHQCGTIQLDFNLPERFNLQFRASEDTEEVAREKLILSKAQSEIAEKIIEGKRLASDEIKEPIDAAEEEQAPKQQVDKEVSIQSEGRNTKKKEKKGKQQQEEEKSPELSLERKSSDSSILTASEIHSVLHEKKYELGYHHLKPGFQRPVIIHRAIYGSFERFVAILTEQFGGKWPFWLSPKQLSISPIAAKYNDYADRLANRFRFEGYRAIADVSDMTMKKKIRDAQLEHYNYIGIVGAEEERDGTIDIRDRDKSDRIGKFTVEELIRFFKAQEPEVSGKYTELKEKAYFRPQEQAFVELNQELSAKVYLSEDGFSLGERDQKIFADYQNVDVDKILYPNLHRWKQFMRHHKGLLNQSQEVPQEGNQQQQQ